MLNWLICWEKNFEWYKSRGHLNPSYRFIIAGPSWNLRVRIRFKYALDPLRNTIKAKKTRSNRSFISIIWFAVVLFGPGIYKYNNR